MTTDDRPPPWGHFAPRGIARLVVLARQAGLSHGPIKRTLEGIWRARNHDLPVDIRYRGARFRLHPSDNTVESRLMFASRRRDRVELEAIARRAGPAATFVDIGANVGYYAVTAAMEGMGRVLAIEPHPRAHARLAFNIACNQLGGRVVALRVALGERTGTGTLLTSMDDVGASLVDSGSGSPPDLPGDEIRSVKIALRTLSEVLLEHRFDTVDAMKIDVEGAEDRVLQPFFEAADPARWPHLVVIEHTSRDRWDHDVLAWMTGSGGYTEIGRTRSNAILARE